MDEKGLNKKAKQKNIKEVWEAPKLICLDKGKTEGGFTTGTFEDSTYSNPAS